MTAASPGVIANFLPNEFYPTEEAYLYALAEVMKDEYNAVAESGLILQVWGATTREECVVRSAS